MILASDAVIVDGDDTSKYNGIQQSVPVTVAWKVPVVGADDAVANAVNVTAVVQVPLTNENEGVANAIVGALVPVNTVFVAVYGLTAAIASVNELGGEPPQLAVVAPELQTMFCNVAAVAVRLVDDIS